MSNQSSGQISGEARSARKGVIATAAMSVVLAANTKTEINWAIDIKGHVAWFFLLGAQLYFLCMWWANDGMSAFWRQIRQVFSHKTYVNRTREVVDRGLTNILLLLGLAITFWNLFRHFILD